MSVLCIILAAPEEMHNLCFYCRKRFVGGIRRIKILRVVTTDGKVLVFTSPMLVEDVLVNFSGLGIGVSKQGSSHLPVNYELRLGKVYYMLPLGFVERKMTEDAAPVRRVKIVITKQKLHELLAKQISMEDVVAGMQQASTSYSHYSSSSWTPKLETIPEEVDNINTHSSANI